MRAKEFIKENDVEERPKVKQPVVEDDGYDDDMVAKIIAADAMPTMVPMSVDDFKKWLKE